MIDFIGGGWSHLQLQHTTHTWPAGVAFVIVGGLCAPPAPLHHQPLLEKQAWFGVEAMEAVYQPAGGSVDSYTPALWSAKQGGNLSLRFDPLWGPQLL